MAKFLSSVAIPATKIGAPHTPGGAVVVRRVIETDLKSSGHCHGDGFVETFTHDKLIGRWKPAAFVRFSANFYTDGGCPHL